MAADRSREDRPDAAGSREPEIRRPASGATRLTPEEITSRGFASAFRGVSETEVRNFLRRVADELAAARDHERTLADRVASLEEQLRNPPPLDEQQLLDGLGEETTRVLRSAQEAAADIRTRAEERSAELLRESEETSRTRREEADAHAAEVTGAAEAVAAERERESLEHAEAARAGAERDAALSAERATATADAEIERARETGRAMVEEARAVRERVLADLARRRALMQAQIDELRTGREQLLEAYRVVKQTLGAAIAALGAVQAKAHTDGSVAVEAVPDDGVDFSLDAADALATAAAATAGPAPTGNAPDATDDADLAGAGLGDEDPARTENPASATAVDALFARLKEERAEPEGAPEAPPAVTADSDTDADTDAGAGADEAEKPGPDRPDPAVAAGDVPSAAEPAAAAAVTVDLARDEPTPRRDAPAPVVHEVPPELAARDDAVGKVRSALGRRAKRALQDEQNELLDALRKTKGRPTADAVLPSPEDLGAAWADVLAPGVDEVYRSAARATAPDATTDGVPREVLLALAAELGAPLREKLVTAFTAGADDHSEDGDVAQRVGARYREWRTQALDDALGDALVGAWARGTLDAAPEDSRLRWVTPAEGCCPDCDDDALETAPRGEAFPTGQVAPPAHPGCRCVVVVETVSVSSAAAAGGSQ